jgi:hypothetical protein
MVPHPVKGRCTEDDIRDSMEGELGKIGPKEGDTPGKTG